MRGVVKFCSFLIPNAKQRLYIHACLYLLVCARVCMYVCVVCVVSDDACANVHGTYI